MLSLAAIWDSSSLLSKADITPVMPRLWAEDFSWPSVALMASLSEAVKPAALWNTAIMDSSSGSLV
ncbi:hypothetical protein D3C75_1289740 [compost metagenome]